jgi:hypothetical protein
VNGINVIRIKPVLRLELNMLGAKLVTRKLGRPNRESREPNASLVSPKLSAPKEESG